MHDTTLADEHDMTVGKFLLEFTSQSIKVSKLSTIHVAEYPLLESEEVPLLDFVEGGKKGDRDENDNSFLSTSNLNLQISLSMSIYENSNRYLSCRVELQWSQFLFQVWYAGFKIIKGLSDLKFCLVWCANLGNFACCRHLVSYQKSFERFIGENKYVGRDGWIDEKFDNARRGN